MPKEGKDPVKREAGLRSAEVREKNRKKGLANASQDTRFRVSSSGGCAVSHEQLVENAHISGDLRSENARLRKENEELKEKLDKSILIPHKAILANDGLEKVVKLHNAGIKRIELEIQGPKVRILTELESERKESLEMIGIPSRPKKDRKYS